MPFVIFDPKRREGFTLPLSVTMAGETVSRTGEADRCCGIYSLCSLRWSFGPWICSSLGFVDSIEASSVALSLFVAVAIFNAVVLPVAVLIGTGSLITHCPSHPSFGCVILFACNACRSTC